MKLRCVIIDNEADAIRALQIALNEYLSDKVEVVGTADSVIDGKALISRVNPDLVFLDIEMPQGGGFSIVESFPDRMFRLAFVTAYDQYAIRALKLQAADYLLKPIDIDELETFITSQWQSLNTTASPAKVRIPTKQSTLLVDPMEIVYIKGEGRYSEVVLQDRKSYLVSKNIGTFTSELSDLDFVRVHKSYLVNLKHVRSLNPDDSILLSNGARAEISRRKKQELKARLL